MAFVHVSIGLIGHLSDFLRLLLLGLLGPEFHSIISELEKD